MSRDYFCYYDSSGALTSVGNSLVGAVIGNGRQIKDQEVAPLLTPIDRDEQRQIKVGYYTFDAQVDIVVIFIDLLIIAIP